MSALAEAARKAYLKAADNPNMCEGTPGSSYEEVFHQPTKVQAKQYIVDGNGIAEMAIFVGKGRSRVYAGFFQVWNSILREWLPVRHEWWVIKGPHGDGHLMPVSPVVYARDYSPNTPTSSLSAALAAENEVQGGHRDTALRAVREAQGALGVVGVAHLGLVEALTALSNRVADELTAFNRAGVVDNHTKSRDQVRDAAESLLGMVRVAKAEIGKAKNHLSSAAGSLRR